MVLGGCFKDRVVVFMNARKLWRSRDFARHRCAAGAFVCKIFHLPGLTNYVQAGRVAPNSWLLGAIDPGPADNVETGASWVLA